MGYPKYGETGDIKDWVRDTENLDEVGRALAREHVIRGVIADTGESREIVVEMVDAALGMGHEAVLDLTDGRPFSLRDSLGRYVGELESRDELQPRDRIVEELMVIADYPYARLPELEMEEVESRNLSIVLGGHEVYLASWEDAGSGGLQIVKNAVKAVYDTLRETR